MIAARGLAALAAWGLLGLAPAASAVEVGEEAPAFSLPRLTGAGTLGSAPARGKRAQLVVFWSAHCGSCRLEAPHVARLARQLKGKPVELVAIHVDDTADSARRFLKQRGLSYPVAFDATGETATAYDIPGTPAVYLVDSRGIVRYHSHVLPTVKQIEGALK
jgi:peroxiredoxin